MALPDVLRNTLENALIPFKTIAFGAMAATAVAATGALVLPEKPAEHAANIAMNTAKTGLAASVFTLGIGQVLIWDSRKRLDALRIRHPWVEASESREENRQDFQVPVVPMPRPSFLDELAELAGLNKEETRPSACNGCHHYHGVVYCGEKGANRLICGMHPDGCEGETCPDWEGIPCQYRLIRLQGIGFSNLFFVRVIPGMSIPEMLASAVEVHRFERNRLMARFKLKSTSGLPGCRFESKSNDIEQAFLELLDSCPE